MRRLLLPALWASLLLAPLGAAAQGLAPNYRLAPSPWKLQAEPDGLARPALLTLGPVSLSAVGGVSGGGLSLQAGQQWFARAAIGSSLDSEALSLGGGYRFNNNEALSMHVTRQLGQERLGLAVRYDRAAAYLRVSYDGKLGVTGQAEMLKFSAGVRF